MSGAHCITSSRGRPRGDRRDRFTRFVSANGQFTMRDVAQSLGMDLREANQVLQRALSAREIRPRGTTRLPDAKRPVLVYEPAAEREAGGSGAAALAMQLRCWGQ